MCVRSPPQTEENVQVELIILATFLSQLITLPFCFKMKKCNYLTVLLSPKIYHLNLLHLFCRTSAFVQSLAFTIREQLSFKLCQKTSQVHCNQHVCISAYAVHSAQCYSGFEQIAWAPVASQNYSCVLFRLSDLPIWPHRLPHIHRPT